MRVFSDFNEIKSAVGTEIGVSDWVKVTQERIVRESGLPNETNAMFTNVEGEWDEVMSVLKACVDAVAAHAPRVIELVLEYTRWRLVRLRRDRYDEAFRAGDQTAGRLPQH